MRSPHGWIAALALGLALCLGPARAMAEGRFALVIGNDHYLNLDKDRQLQKAVNDAKAVGDALEKDGFTVLRGTDLTRAQIVDKLYDLSAHLHPGDTAAFYFAGHGVALGNGNYLLPSDVPDIDEGQETRLANQSVAESDIIATLQDKGARVSIMILDACRDNPFRRPGLRSVGQERGFGHMPEANGIFTLYSAGYGQSALDRLSDVDPNPNSVFTRVLVPLLTRPGLNLDDLAFDVREDVAKLAASTPDHHAQIPAAYNQVVGGRIYLVPSSGVEPPGPGPVSTAVPDPAHAAAAVVATATPEPVQAPVPAAPADPSAIALSMQAELNRLGCEAGPATGSWTDRSRLALLHLARTRDLAVNVDQPAQPTLDILRGLAPPGCPADRPTRPTVIHHAVPEPAPRIVRRIAQQVDVRRQERSIARHVQSTAAPQRSGCFSFNGRQVCD